MQLPRPAPTCPGVADDAPRGHQRGVAEADPVVGHRRPRGYPRPAGRSAAQLRERNGRWAAPRRPCRWAGRRLPDVPPLCVGGGRGRVTLREAFLRAPELR